MRKLFLILLTGISSFVCSQVVYSPEMIPLIIQDIYEEMVEEGVDIDFEEVETGLRHIADNPINLNTATEQELQQLLFLSDEQIDAILLYSYRNHFNSLYDLQLIPQLRDYEIRDLLPFVYVGEYSTKEPFYWKEMWHYAKQGIDLRFDARSIENNGNDPFYLSAKYSFQYRKKIDAGLVAERDPAEPFYAHGKTYGTDFYGGWLQIDDIWRFKRLVVGDYRVCFGQGLVINTNMNYGGKVAALYQHGLRAEGLKRKSSTQEYNFLRGAGATLKLGIADITAFYSARKVDGRVSNGHFSSIQSTGYHRTESELDGKRGVWQQVIGSNVTLHIGKSRHQPTEQNHTSSAQYLQSKWGQLKLGFTIAETFLGDTLTPRNLYYNNNYFRGNRQFTAGMNYNWQIWRAHIFGEIATAQNVQWGLGNITGIQITPINGFTISAIYRYYSPHFDNLWASGFGESSRLNDEHGALTGFDIRLPKNWQLSVYGDYFYFSGPKYGIRNSSDGFEIYGIAKCQLTTDIAMQFNLRYKRKADNDKYQFSYTLSAEKNNWTSKTGIVGNLTLAPYVSENDDETPECGMKDMGLGGAIYEQVGYQWTKVPITLQARLEAFYAPKYNNRIYIYENDVLNAFSIPMLYGIGGRWFVNFRYKINNMFSIYLKAAQTIFTDETVEKQSYNSHTRSEIHTLLRIKW